MISDPIIEEIYQVREKLLSDCEGNLRTLMERLKAEESKHHPRVVYLEEIRRRREEAQIPR